MSAIGRIITGVSGSPRNLPAVRYAAALARGQAAPLILVLARVPPGGQALDIQFPPPPCLRQEWEKAARLRLNEAINMALGSVPAEASAELAVVCGDAGPVLARVAGRPGDLLVVGTGRRGIAGRLAGGKISRYCLAHATSPVLAVPPATLDLEAGHGLHRWAFRRHGLDLSELAAGR